MKKILLVLLFVPLISFSQQIEGNKILSIKVSVGEWQSSPGEYLNLKTIYAPYNKGVFDGIISGKVLPVGGDFPLYYQEDGKTFEDLDNPQGYDRERWIQKIAQTHWTLDEVKEGLAWKHMRKYVK